VYNNQSAGKKRRKNINCPWNLKLEFNTWVCYVQPYCSFFTDLPRNAHKSWLPAIVFSIKTLLKQHGERGDEESNKDSTLPPCSDFLETSCSVVFKCDDVNVVLIPTNDWEPFDGFKGLYQAALSQTDEEAHP